MPDPAFVVTFGCDNCGDEWTDEYPPRTKVGERYNGERVLIRNTDCEVFPTQCDDDCCYVVWCSTCEHADPVHVADRAPIGEGEAS